MSDDLEEALDLPINCYSGRLVVLEGTDGAGKTTLLSLCEQHLRFRNIPAKRVRMPSLEVRTHPIFRAFHDSPDESYRTPEIRMALTTLVSGDRLVTQYLEVIPALSEGTWVLCDRYIYTGLVISSHPLIRQICRQFIRPDLCILADVDALTAKDRIDSRGLASDKRSDVKEIESDILRYRSLALVNGFRIYDSRRPISDIRPLLSADLDRLVDQQP